MSEKEQTFRTSAFHTGRRGGYLFRFWIMSPAYGKPGFQIKEYEKGVDCGTTSRIEDGLALNEGLKKLDELEQKEAATRKRVVDKDDALGPEYREAKLFTDAFDATVADSTYERLKKRRPTSPSFKLKKP
ncbi:MAG: hypothetical protein EPN97_17285 [Alphaproteobacteria bacterium]|nr:MAG: hypothetical protein EPN97_17285 [Alphaproteobacteria bacterium]